MESNNLWQVKKMYTRLDQMLAVSGSACAYLNLGYWKHTNLVVEACEALIDLVVEMAEMGNGKKILDVGYGYGEQDIYIAGKFADVEIHGLNIFDKQVDIAQQRVEQAALAHRVFLTEGDAVNMPFDASAFDIILAIESAFHFDPRHRFFEESYRVLKPGGILCLTDCLPAPFVKKDLQFFEASANMGIPVANQYNLEEYINKLEQAGFEKISAIDLSEHVLPYSAVEMMQDKGWRARPAINLPEEKDIEEKLQHFTETTTIASYYLIKAFKK